MSNLFNDYGVPVGDLNALVEDFGRRTYEFLKARPEISPVETRAIDEALTAAIHCSCADQRLRRALDIRNRNRNRKRRIVTEEETLLMEEIDKCLGAGMEPDDAEVVALEDQLRRASARADE